MYEDHIGSPFGPLPRRRLPYLGNDEYPRGLRGGTACAVHFFFPHIEQRMRFATSSSFAFQPHSRPRVCGSAMRSWPHAEHFKTKVYCPNSSLNLSTWKCVGMPPIVLTIGGASPSSTEAWPTLYKTRFMR
jgi:hypothetical protein